MAGLLDFEDPNTVGALQFGMGLLNAGGPSRTPISFGQGIAQAGSGAMDAMRQARQDQVSTQMRNLQMQELARKTKAAQAAEAAKLKILNDPATDPRLRQYVEMGGDISKLFDPTSIPEGGSLSIPGLAMTGGNPVVAQGSPKRTPPMVEHNFSIGENKVQPHISLDQGVTWNPLQGSSPSAKFAKQVIPVGGLTGNLEKPMTAAQKQKFEKTIADDFKSTGQVMQTMNQLTKSISDVGSSKGLSAREGYSGYIPAWMQGKDAMTAENRIETLKGKVTQMGKAMATMSGAIGPMAVQEWKIVSDAVNALDPKAGNFTEQIGNVQAQAEGASARIQDWYDRRYSDSFDKYPQFKTDSIPVYPTGGGGQSVGGKIGGAKNVRSEADKILGL